MKVQFNCPKCHIVSEVETIYTTETRRFNDGHMEKTVVWKQGILKVTCPVCLHKEETEVHKR